MVQSRQRNRRHRIRLNYSDCGFRSGVVGVESPELFRVSIRHTPLNPTKIYTLLPSRVKTRPSLEFLERHASQAWETYLSAPTAVLATED